LDVGFRSVAIIWSRLATVKRWHLASYSILSPSALRSLSVLGDQDPSNNVIWRESRKVGRWNFAFLAGAASAAERHLKIPQQRDARPQRYFRNGSVADNRAAQRDDAHTAVVSRSSSAVLQALLDTNSIQPSTAIGTYPESLSPPSPPAGIPAKSEDRRDGLSRRGSWACR